MHTNHRRKKGRHNPKREGQGWSMNQVNWHPFKQAFWRQYRARTNSLIVRGRFDDIPNIIPDTIRYDYW